MDVVRVISQVMHSILARDPQWRWEIIDHADEIAPQLNQTYSYNYTLYSNTTPVVEITESRGYQPDAPKHYRVRTPGFQRRAFGFCDVRTTVSNVKAVLDGCYTPTQVDAIAAEVKRWTRDDMRWLQWDGQ